MSHVCDRHMYHSHSHVTCMWKKDARMCTRVRHSHISNSLTHTWHDPFTHTDKSHMTWRTDASKIMHSHTQKWISTWTRKLSFFFWLFFHIHRSGSQRWQVKRQFRRASLSSAHFPQHPPLASLAVRCIGNDRWERRWIFSQNSQKSFCKSAL